MTAAVLSVSDHSQLQLITMASKKTQRPKLPPTSRSLPISLIRAREGIMPPIREMLAESGITEQQWRVLRVLAEYGPQDTTTLANRASLLLPSLTRIAKNMNHNGLITLSRDHEDRRRQTIAITAAGVKIVDDNRANTAKIVREMKAKLGADNYEALLDLLSLLAPEMD